MDKIISWFIIMFIGLVPLGAFFDTKQSLKPNMEQFFMKREKRASNSSQCGNSCELQFSSLLNITLVLDSGVYFDLSKFDIELPNDVKNQNKNYPNRLPFFMDSQAFLPIKDFFQKYGTFQSIGSKKIYTIPKVVDIVIKLRNLSPYSLIFFSAEIPLPEKDNEQLLPTEITKNDGEYQYNQFQDKLDYLMIQRRDFDKFNYSYLYWVPIFNFFDDNFKYMSEMSIALNGFKQNSKFTLIRSFEPENSLYFFDILEFSSFNDMFRIEIVLGMVTFYLNDEQLIKFRWLDGWTKDFINTFFGQINYYGNTFDFLRYDDKLKSDFKDFMLYYQKNLTIDFINGLFNKIYKVLGDFFVQFFYASFDMDDSTYVELDYKGMKQIPKNVLQMGFFYRSLITFYPKQYLINFGSTIENSKNMIFRSYFFVKDKQTANGFNAGKSSYQIDFNVLKAYDNQLWNATSNTLHFYNAKVDVMYGINIFTLTFPLYKKKNESTEYHYSLYDFNILNSTAFIGGGISGNMNDLIPTPNCSYWGLFSAISCGIQHASVSVLNWLLGLSGINLLIRPIADIAKTTINFTETAFPVFEAIPAFQMLFEFVVPLAILLMILKKFS
ncbi:hypothetical protein [Spiroplasma endosymbiont of Nephrotoma flavescens]|uniref:hypothetical protein n=1 Tax=Spiroplasma endosymbiont of Nephrotoma flavescens TaxID=3066302 RepID=UPI00313D665B